MFVLVKSAPDTVEGRRGVATAKTLQADLVLLQNGVYFAQKGRLRNFPGAVYVVDDDKRLRGIGDAETEGAVQSIDYDRLVDLITGGDKVVGLF